MDQVFTSREYMDQVFTSREYMDHDRKTDESWDKVKVPYIIIIKQAQELRKKMQFSLGLFRMALSNATFSECILLSTRKYNWTMTQ